MTDINLDADSTVQLDARTIRGQLAARHGRAFDQLVHLAYIASLPHYSQLGFTRSPDSLVVAVGDWYRLTFVEEKGRVRLRRVGYYELEGD